jgi:hypothetical protein
VRKRKRERGECEGGREGEGERERVDEGGRKTLSFLRERD